ncbi:MAG: alpha/beta hydrolase [Mycobacterium sp.]
MSAPTRLGAGRHIAANPVPVHTITTVHELSTADGATVSGVLRTVPGARSDATLMHPLQDFTHHVLVPELLSHGVAVWTQSARSPNNDLALLHEQAVLDMAAGQVFLRDKGFDHVIPVGHSGGGTLAALYHQQAGLPAEDRITHTPTGRAVDLAAASLPVPDAAVFMAPHPGQGALLQRVIDPSVTDEADPMSVDPDLDPYSPANGFAEPPASSSYSAEFVQRYREAQRARIHRIDQHAMELAADATAAREAFKNSADPADRRRSLAPRLTTVYRTDADLRSVDLSLDRNDRPYGSLFGSRPDLINYGLTGFGRLSTPDAWLSTWSANYTHADFLRCAPGVSAPSLLVEFTGDQACFPADARAMIDAIAATDKTHERVRGRHFGGAIAEGEPTGAVEAGKVIGAWLRDRYPDV